MQKVLGKAVRILGLNERKGRWVVRQDFMDIFGSMLQGVWLFSPVSLTESCSFCYGLRYLFTPHKSVDKVVLDL